MHSINLLSRFHVCFLLAVNEAHVNNGNKCSCGRHFATLPLLSVDVSHAISVDLCLCIASVTCATLGRDCFGLIVPGA